MTATNRGAKRVESEFYPTPAAFVRAILPHLPFAGSILEPMAGDGAVVRVLVEAGHPCIDMIEIDRTRADLLREAGADGAILVGSALGFESNCLWDMPHGLVITNPAFSLAEALAERSIRAQLPHGGTTALFVPQSFLGTAGRRAFWREHPCDWYQCFQRPEFVASMGCSKKCGWRETIAIDADRPKACPACGAKTTCATTDAREYGWAVWGPGRAPGGIGPHNEAALGMVLGSAVGPLIAAWGRFPSKKVAARLMSSTLRVRCAKPLCYGKTKDGEPRHPLMLAYSTPLLSMAP